MFNADIPITTQSNDLLGRSNFSKSLGDAIINYNDTNSISIGLFGKWGSGKTSVINLALEHINKVNNEKSNDTKTIILKFNPWNYSDQNQLILQFFKQLSILLRRKDYSEIAKKAGGEIEKYAKLLVPFKYIPVIGQYTEIAKSAFSSFGSHLKSWGNDKSIEVIKNELNEILEKLNQKILVVIDDIDRLNNSEIRQIFQLVKSIADFKNTIYLLAFDKEVIIRALSKVQEGDGNEYLEKVIQVPYEIPSIPREYLEKLLFKQLDDIIKDLPENKWDKTYWGNIYHSGIKYLINTLRDVNRYLNTLRFSYDIIKAEINAIDFLAITAIQVFLPKVYNGIKINKDTFCGTRSILDSYSSKIIKDESKSIVDEIISNIDSTIKDNIFRMLKYLFPNIQTYYENMSYGYGFINEWRSKCRICSQDIFDIYFKLSLPEGEISQSEIDNFLKNSGKIESVTGLLLNFHKENRISRFLERLEDYTRETISEENIEIIITALMDIGDKFIEDYELSIWGTSNSMRLLRLFYQLSHRFKEHDKRFLIFKNAIEKSNNSLYTIVHEVGVQCQQHGKYDLKENPEPIENCTVTSEQLNELENLACRKIEEYYRNGNLLSHGKLVSILYMWKRWKINNEYDNFLKTVIDNKNNLITFLTAFLNKSSSQSIGDYTATINWGISLKNINDFIDTNKIEPIIRKIFTSEIYSSLNEKTQIAISLFLDTFDGKIKSIYDE